jgi:hypothetical protein
VDLIGKGGHIRTVPIPEWIKSAVDQWTRAAGVTEGRIFRAVVRAGKVWGKGLSQNVVWYVVKTCCERAGLEHRAARRRHAEAISAWDPATQPAWLTAEAYAEKVQPLLASLPNSVIASQIGVGRWYAGRIRQGYRPHPRHWQALADLVGAPRFGLSRPS